MSNNIKENHIRHTQEAIEDILDGLKNFDLLELEIAIEQLVVFGLPLGDNDNHQSECVMVDYQVPAFPSADYIEAWKRTKVLEAYLNHQMYDKYGDLWHDMVEELLISLYRLLPSKD